MFEKIFQRFIGLFAVRFTQPVGRGLVRVSAVASARGGGALRSLRDGGRRGARFEKQFHSGLKGPQTSHLPIIWPLGWRFQVAAPGVAELIVGESKQLPLRVGTLQKACEALKKGVEKTPSEVGDSCVVWQILVEEWLARMSSGL
jgi:hypothetical protein